MRSAAAATAAPARRSSAAEQRFCRRSRTRRRRRPSRPPARCVTYGTASGPVTSWLRLGSRGSDVAEAATSRLALAPPCVAPEACSRRRRRRPREPRRQVRAAGGWEEGGGGCGHTHAYICMYIWYMILWQLNYSAI